jgi:hypothetical protein
LQVYNLVLISWLGGGKGLGESTNDGAGFCNLYQQRTGNTAAAAVQEVLERKLSDAMYTMYDGSHVRPEEERWVHTHLHGSASRVIITGKS